MTTSSEASGKSNASRPSTATYIDIFNFPKTWQEKDLIDFVSKSTKSKVSRGTIHKSNPLRATVAFKGFAEVESLVQRLSGKIIIPPEQVPMILKVCGEGSTKVVLSSLPSTIDEKALEELLRKHGDIEKMEFTKGSGGPYGTKCTVTFKYREQAVDAMIYLEDHRYIGEATVPMSVKLFEEERPESAKPAPTKKEAPTEHKPEPVKPATTLPAQTPATVPSASQAPATQVPTSFAPQGQAVVYIEYTTPQGNPYYYNTVTRKTQWELPPANAAVFGPNLVPKNLPGYIRTIPANAKAFNMPKFTEKKGPPGCNVFIYHLPHEWTEQDIYLHFSPFGTMVNARVIVDPLTKLPKGYGFASYDNQKSALKAVQVMDGFTVSGKSLQVSIKKDDFDFKAMQKRS